MRHAPVRRPSPCVQALCESGVLLQSSLEAPHSTLHTALWEPTPHLTLTLHTPHLISSHLISSHLSSSHLTSALLMSSYLFSYMSSKFFSQLCPKAPAKGFPKNGCQIQLFSPSAQHLLYPLHCYITIHHLHHLHLYHIHHLRLLHLEPRCDLQAEIPKDPI